MTINKRIGLAKKSIYEIKHIVEDSRTKVIGGIKTGLLLWNSCILPFLLNNAGTWINMKKSDTDRLTKLQNLFLNNLLDTYNCPVPLMYFDLALLQIHLQILKQKLLLFHHISCLPENSVARNILTISQQFHFPGLHNEVNMFLVEHEITDVGRFSKAEWKTHISKILESENRKNLLHKSRNYKKLDYISLSLEDYELKDYFCSLDLERARMRFKERSGCVSTCRRQFSSEFIRRSFYCPSCNTQSVDVIKHWVRCSSYQKFLISRDIQTEKGLLSFYLDVINYRKSQLDQTSS